MPSENEDQSRSVDRRASRKAGAGDDVHDDLKTEEAASVVQEEPLSEQLEAEKQRSQSYLASWQRAAADYQNFKRRVEQEREDLARLASGALIVNLLPIVDDMERALQSVDSHLAGLTWVDGVRLIYRKFQALLEINGVEEILAEGRSFDPTMHEAVMFGEGDEGNVLSVVQKGYRLGGRVIRPAMVVVGRGAKEQGT